VEYDDLFIYVERFERMRRRRQDVWWRCRPTTAMSFHAGTSNSSSNDIWYKSGFYTWIYVLGNYWE